MGYGCSVEGCKSNGRDSPENVTVFEFPVDEPDRCARWIKFAAGTRKNWTNTPSSRICKRHFEPKYFKTGATNARYRLIKGLKPVPTIRDPDVEESPEVAHMKAPVSVPRRSPRKRLFQEDEYSKFLEADIIRSFSDIDDKLTPSGWSISKFEEHLVFFKLTTNALSVPEVTSCIRVDNDLHVKLFYKGAPVPLPEWFRKGRDCKLTRRSMLQNLPNYIELEGEQTSSIFEELRKLQHQKKPKFSMDVIRYALLLRYTSLQSYRLNAEHFPLPSLSFLRKISEGGIDTVKGLKALKAKGKISKDVILIFDEMYLQKCEEYSGGQTIGANEENELYKGVVSFLVVGLKQNVSYMVKSVPETKIDGKFLKEGILESIRILEDCDFRVRAVVSDDHSANVSAFQMLLRDSNQDKDSLFMMHGTNKIYLFHDTVHLLKSVRNNLVNCKRFLFPSFKFEGFLDKIEVPGGAVHWKTFHDVFEKDKVLQASLRQAPRINAKVLHPGNCKQSVPIALSIFDDKTSAAIENYFPDRKDAAAFLKLFSTWWNLSNSKDQFSNNKIGNAAVKGDKKPEFLRAMANWIELWSDEKIPASQKFTLTPQTSTALIRTLRCHAQLIEDLLDDGFDFVLTARFQSDPIERRFGQYRQMSGGRFLVSLKDTIYSEKIIKIKSLLKAGCNIDDSVKEKKPGFTEECILLRNPLISEIPLDSLDLSQASREVAVHVAGYIARKVSKPKRFPCCREYVVGEYSESNPDHSYIGILNRGGLTIPSTTLLEYVCSVFAVLDWTQSVLKQSKIPDRRAAHLALKNIFKGSPLLRISCDAHKDQVQNYVNQIAINIFFNNQRTIATAAVRKDQVVEVKKMKLRHDE